MTEDADLGYRLARFGWRVAMIGAPTYEEAPIAFSAWLRQRTRWIKGHLQTWLVLMRNPIRSANEMGLAAFLSMQFVLAGGVLAALLHLPLALMMLTSPWTLAHVGPADLALAAAGYAASIYGGWIGARMALSRRLVFAALTMPFYWMLLCAPALGALWGLIRRPFYWSKTAHGVSARPDPLRRRPADAATPRRVRATAPMAKRRAGAQARGAAASD